MKKETVITGMHVMLWFGIISMVVSILDFFTFNTDISWWWLAISIGLVSYSSYKLYKRKSK